MKDTMVRHSVKEALANKQMLEEQGKSLRKHHFQFGFDRGQDAASAAEQQRAKSIS
jgi:hypothetical protein